MTEQKNLIFTEVSKLRGKDRMIKAIARALVWTPAYLAGMGTEVRYETARVLYDRGIRVSTLGIDYIGDDDYETRRRRVAARRRGKVSRKPRAAARCRFTEHAG